MSAPAPAAADLRMPAGSVPSAPLRGRIRVRASWPIAFAGFVVSALGSWIPSLWYDEAATVTSAARSWSELWHELGRVDAVHGVYYVFMHGWFDLVGYTPWTLRLPSAIAVGVAAGLVVELGRALAGRRVGIVAGVVFLLIPRVLWAGGEGRPYAAVIALATLMTLLGVLAARRALDGRPSLRGWAAYAAVCAVGVVVNVYLALVVAAHGVTVLSSACARRGGMPLADGRVGRMSRAWGAAAASVALTTAPFVVFVATQSGQVSWIRGVGPWTLRQVFQSAWFGSSPGVATVFWLLMIASSVLAFAVRSARRRLLPPLAVLVPLLAVPSVVLLGATAAGAHLYSPKYAGLSTPFIAITVALLVTWLSSGARAVVALALLAVLVLPVRLQLLAPDAKQSSRWADLASLLDRERRPGAAGVLYAGLDRHPSGTAQMIGVAYPEPFHGLRNVGVASTGARSGRLWDRNGDLSRVVPPRLAGLGRVWLVVGTRPGLGSSANRVLRSEHFRPTARWTVGDVVLIRWDRAVRAAEGASR